MKKKNSLTYDDIIIISPLSYLQSDFKLYGFKVPVWALFYHAHREGKRLLPLVRGNDEQSRM